MKKRFLPFSLLLVIMVLGQSMAIADQGGHYVPRTQTTMNAESFMGSLRANQNTGLIDPADMFKAMQWPRPQETVPMTRSIGLAWVLTTWVVRLLLSCMTTDFTKVIPMVWFTSAPREAVFTKPTTTASLGIMWAILI